MPKELKKRGRRAAKQRKEVSENEGPPSKKRRTDSAEQNFTIKGDAGDDFITFGEESYGDKQQGPQATFYGLLTEDEQEYFASVNNKIIANDFEHDEDRTNFIDAVYRETAGKEIKIASSQSCSRYLEKIIRLSTPNQLRSLFLAFLHDLDYLVQHRFGSHCCETLFLESAKHVDPKSKATEAGDTSFETLFLEAEEKLEDNIGFLLTERFASHTVRVLLLVLSNQPLGESAAQDVVAIRRKAKSDVVTRPEVAGAGLRKVPAAFKKARRRLVGAAVSDLNTTYLRALATSPIGSPVLQLLLRLELSDTDGKDADNHMVLQKLVPDRRFEPESDSSKFISSLAYDSTGCTRTLSEIASESWQRTR